ncbi:MAG: hypothetical protein JXQ99_03525 [Hyphomicrobiaceae bacterium]
MRNVLLSLCLAVFVSGCDGPLIQQTAEFRYRLTVKIELDGKQYVGSSVIQSTQISSRCIKTQGSKESGCGSAFVAKGVAPIIRLPNGDLLIAVLQGHGESTRDPFRQDWNGANLASMPWYLYVPWPWNRTRQYPMVRMPTETPPLEIPFAGHKLSRHKPAILWVPKEQKYRWPEGRFLGPQSVRKITNLDMELKSFRIEATKDQVLEIAPNMPNWIELVRRGKMDPNHRENILARKRPNYWFGIGHRAFETGSDN